MERFSLSTEIDADMIFSKNMSVVFYSLHKRFLTVLDDRNEITSDEKSIVAKCYDYYKKRPSIVKIINRELPDSGDEIIPVRLSHPNIIKYEWFEKTDSLSFIYMKKFTTDLIDFFGEEHRQEYVIPIFKKMCLAVDYLHSQRIAHFDIKLENYLMDENMNIVLADFGFAEEWEDPEPEVTVFKGSWYYVAPEVLAKKSYLITKPDIWGLGICLFAMIMGRFPFVDDKPRINIRDVPNIEFPPFANPQLKEIVYNTIIEDYRERPSAPKILEWLK